MTSILELEQEQIAKLTNATMPVFGPGDTVIVNVKVVEGTRERIQAFEGVCIARKNAGLHSSFTVRKISYGEGVERVFPLYSPRIAGVELVRRGRFASSTACSAISWRCASTSSAMRLALPRRSRR